MKKFNRILLILTVILSVGGVVWLIVAVHAVHRQTLCKEVNINVKYSNGDIFITERQILNLAESAGKLEQQPIEKIDIAALKKQIEQHPYASHVDVKTSIDGILKISVIQREAIARVFNQNGDSYYIDREGVLLPILNGSASRVITANGYIGQNYTEQARYQLTDPKADSLQLASNPLFKVYKMAMYIDKKPFLKAFVEQIYINDRNEIEIIPKLGDQLIQFGDIDRMEEKFTFLKSFYHSAMNNGGWDKYATICLKYKNQIVCSKN